MEGIILDFTLADRNGVVRCNQGHRYPFSLDQWRSSDLPKAGERVDFVVGADQQAANLYRLPAQPAPAAAAATQHPAPSALAIVSLIAGICGLFFFGSLIAVICGHIARANIRDSHGMQTGDGMALGGLVLGYIGLGMTLLALVFIMLAGALA